MRKTVYFITLFIASFIISCNKNSSKNSTVENIILSQDEATYQQEDKRANSKSFVFHTDLDVIAYAGQRFYEGRDYRS